MTFRELITAALKEVATIKTLGGFLDWKIRDVWDWKGTTIFVVYAEYAERECTVFKCVPHSGATSSGSHLVRICETDLLDPSWSPATLAKQIDDEIAKAKK